ncbi:MAG: GNAT family N-acetyltransferase [Nanoarchaeota archaeon]
MAIKIIKLNKKDKKSLDSFFKKEWRKFNIKRNYRWNKKEYNFIAKDNKILGHIKFNIVGGVAYLSEIIVAESVRGKGVSDLLINKFEEIAKKKKCHLLYLETSEKHTEALRFYKKHNYKIKVKLKDNKFHFTWYFLFKKLS